MLIPESHLSLFHQFTEKEKIMIRRIFVDSVSEIDYANFGVHFSENNNYRHTGGGSAGTTKQKRFEVSAFVESAQINEDATKISRAEFPNEKETVLAFNQAVEANIVIIDRETGYFVGSNNGEIRTINTGIRSDKWVK